MSQQDPENLLETQLLTRQRPTLVKKCERTYRILIMLGLILMIIINYISDFNKHSTDFEMYIKISIFAISIFLYIPIFFMTYFYEFLYILSFLSYTLLLILTTILMVSDIKNFI